MCILFSTELVESSESSAGAPSIWQLSRSNSVLRIHCLYWWERTSWFIQLALLGMAILTNICSIAILINKPRVFHVSETFRQKIWFFFQFSFLIFLFEILASGIIKLLVNLSESVSPSRSLVRYAVQWRSTSISVSHYLISKCSLILVSIHDLNCYCKL